MNIVELWEKKQRRNRRYRQKTPSPAEFFALSQRIRQFTILLFYSVDWWHDNFTLEKQKIGGFRPIISVIEVKSTFDSHNTKGERLNSIMKSTAPNLSHEYICKHRICNFQKRMPLTTTVIGNIIWSKATLLS